MAEVTEYSTEDIQPSVPPHNASLEMVGYLGRDEFGRVYLDACRTNEEHLKNHVEGKERPGCRKYIEDMFPADMLGKRVLTTVDVFLTEHKGPKK